ncbi:MAG: hypothetical protein HGA16_00060 [Candidatus Moranbacteria bacterium]|nr:hypothetical protein [Candidatus Moranbacteria bacterium]
MKQRIRVIAFLVLILSSLLGWHESWATEVATDSVAVSTVTGVPEVKASMKHWKRVGGNRFRGNSERAWRQHGLNKAEVVEMRQLVIEKKYEWTTFSNGQEFASVSFGKNRIWKNVVADWAEGKSYAARLYRLSTGKSIAQVLWCHNWAVPIPGPGPEPNPRPNIPPDVPPTVIPKAEEPGYAQIDAELNAGVYEYGNDRVHGRGGYLDASLLFDAGNGFRIGPGVYAAGTSGSLTDESFSWKRPWDIGPQLTVHYASGNHGVVSKSRLLFNAGYSEGSADGWYSFSQSGSMFAQYLEYYARPSKDFKWGIVGEVCVPFGQHVTGSSSQYAEIKDLGSLYFGAYAQHWVSADWAIRGKLGVRYENIISELSLKPEVTARYKEMAYAGVGLNIPFNGHDAVTYEGLAGIELRGTIRKAWKNANGKVQRLGTVSSYESGNAGSEGGMPTSFGARIQ